MAARELLRARGRARARRVASAHARPGVLRHQRAQGGPHERGDHGVHVHGEAQGGGVCVRLPDRRQPGDRGRARQAACANTEGKSPSRPPWRKSVAMEGNEAVGMTLQKGGRTIRARRAVVSNASVWDTVERLLPPEAREARRARGDETHTATNATPCGSFVHLHLGIDAAGSPAARRARDSPPRRRRLEPRRRRRAQRLQHQHSDVPGPEPGARGEARRPRLRRGERAIRGWEATSAGARRTRR